MGGKRSHPFPKININPQESHQIKRALGELFKGIKNVSWQWEDLSGGSYSIEALSTPPQKIPVLLQQIDRSHNQIQQLGHRKKELQQQYQDDEDFELYQDDEEEENLEQLQDAGLRKQRFIRENKEVLEKHRNKRAISQHVQQAQQKESFLPSIQQKKYRHAPSLEEQRAKILIENFVNKYKMAKLFSHTDRLLPEALITVGNILQQAESKGIQDKNFRNNFYEAVRQASNENPSALNQLYQKVQGNEFQ